MGKFQIALPAALRPENGAVKHGDENAGYMYTRGHKYAPSAQVRESEDFVSSLSTELCTVGGVFDGHGGPACSRACAEYIIPQMANKSKTLTRSSACVVFQEAQSHLAHLASQTGDQSGTTATVAVITDENVMTAYVGDSRACIIKVDGSAVFLTGSHRPSDEAEKARVLKQGGFVTEPSGPDDVHRVSGIYAVSRCLGNFGAEGTAGLSQEPEFVVHARQPDDSLLLVASDGVWDSLEASAVAKVAMAALAKGEDMPGVALAVVKRAFAMYSADDIAVFAARLAAPSDGARAAPSTISAYMPGSPERTVRSSGVSLDAARDAAGAMAAPRPRRSSSGVQLGPYTRRVSREVKELLAFADVAAAAAPTAIGGRVPQSEVVVTITPASGQACSIDADTGVGVDGGDGCCVTHTPRGAVKGSVGWHLGRAVRWGVTLAAAAAGVAIIAGRRRR